ncbi:MAG: hypothetical protein CTY34_02135 [Methylobacter sp.]|nr:MAG: hypothetical protein CTY34_02135 [Methylobacter sp.]PPD05144.1 MAG: hypothetical protein CTY29_02465 [Methylobacter sp.]PPD24347.1 MAG: hypothetical protein CTY24_01175 [Methylobacter sp.]
MFKLINRIKKLAKLSELSFQQKPAIELKLSQIETNSELLKRISASLDYQTVEISNLTSRINAMEEQLLRQFSASQQNILARRFRRDYLPNDSAAIHKVLLDLWKVDNTSKIGFQEILASGFRVFSQNDEDGMILRIFSHIGILNQCVVEIGSNCSNSEIGIPENLSANLIVNHGWHGVIIDLDQSECEKMQYFFARDFATRHFHSTIEGVHGYFSPLIIQQAITPDNVNTVLQNVCRESEPDLMIFDIDGGDYDVVENMAAYHPRVLVVEFEKRFRDRHSVVQFDRGQFSKYWAQSGTVSLPAWEKMLSGKGYSLCAIGTCGFNAFFIRSDIAAEKFYPLSSSKAFDFHPILSNVSENFWLEPDETWRRV